MITFKPITIEDKAEIESFTLPYAPANCDLAFANMFCWQFQFKTAWSVVDGFLVIRFQIGGSDRIGYMQPVGAGDFTPVLRHLEEDILAAGQRLRIIDMTPEGLEKLRSVGHCQFAFASDRNLEDYVYNASDLRDLPGRKYQSKRNHINRFEAEYEYRYEPMTRDHAAECMRLEAEWRKTRSGHTGELSAEQRAMQRAFAHFDRLGLIGGCIYVGDKLVAFTYGSPINDHTFCVHVEKADTEYDGAFTIINREFVAHLPEQYTLIDREEDLGIPGLRQAKLSYHPAFLEKKYTALCLYPDEIACKRLWIKCFGDEETFIDSFLIGHYSRKRMLAAEEDGRLAAMLHLIPFESELGRTTYIYGVATDPDYRGRGLASGLMREAMRRIAEEGADAAILIKPGKPQGLLRPVRLRRPVASGRFRSAGRLRLRLGQSGTGSGYGLAPQQQRTAARTFALPASLIPQRTVPQKVRPDASRRPAVLSQVLPNTRFRAIGSEDSTLSEKK
jgi:GNAT superfamily N-acetyltransferase